MRQHMVQPILWRERRLLPGSAYAVGICRGVLVNASVANPPFPPTTDMPNCCGVGASFSEHTFWQDSDEKVSYVGRFRLALRGFARLEFRQVHHCTPIAARPSISPAKLCACAMAAGSMPE